MKAKAVTAKMVKVEQEERAEIFMPYTTGFELKGLMGKFKINSYDEIEVIRDKIKQLPIEEFQQKADGDQAKAQELWFTNSSVSQSSFAWLTKDGFSEVIFQRGFDVGQIDFLEFWIVKKAGV